MRESPDALEERIAELRGAVRRAVAGGDRRQARTLRARLREAERAWDRAVVGEPEPAPAAAPPDRSVRVPAREHVHHALTLLGGPAAPKLILAVHDAFFPGPLGNSRISSLRRDEERSFRGSPYARPYYVCAALTADLLAPARGLLAISTWPLERRMVGPLSPRTDFLTAALRIAEHLERLGDVPTPGARRLLWRFAANIPGAAADPGAAQPAGLAAAARAELQVHAEADAAHRATAARRALDRLDEAEQLFGARLTAVRRRTGTHGKTETEPST
ncbi:hypothetical protein DPM19_03920 [Actinomadura craniellae]|uniref:Uncharacterized protein n=1 Tax=Actinomadura craniellae TaxID=2231787 RepID=A0A365HAC7_9ACTN|nr:hypothetical protein [Actinomadura craniellae]RAY16090.1 hypothetical protein DPM19_03920 [Actinomadura craniellae]